MAQGKLLGDRRFWPFFWTQFLGAFNDNVYRNALVVLITFKAKTLGGLSPEQLVSAAGGLFIAPFFLFSATAGQLADKYPKATLIRWVKLAEIAIMGLGAVGFLLDDLWVLLGVLFLMGWQSAVFGPVKYSLLPQALGREELVGANALVESGTVLAILLGLIAGNLLSELGAGWVATGILLVAALGYGFSRLMTELPAESPSLRLRWNPVTPTLSIVRQTHAIPSVFYSCLGISWFWFLGTLLMSVFPTFAKDTLGGGPSVLTLLLALFCVGSAVGALLCERLSAGKLELGIVPIGSLGLSLFALDLFFASPEFPTGGPGWRVAVDLALFSVAGGFYIVPLYALIQERSPADIRSRVVAGNNILNALFMVAASLFLVVLLGRGFTPPEIFLVVAGMNLAVAGFIYGLIPEFLYRFVAWCLAHVMYRLETEGTERIPDKGPAVLVCNHVSFIDWLIIASACRRPVRFVMDYRFMKIPLLSRAFRDAKVIPIAPLKESREVLTQAMDAIARELAAGEVVCLFPEGRLTADGELNPFRPGVEKIVERTPVPVIPMALQGVWGSFFSRKDGAALRRPFRRVFSRIRLVVGEPVPPETVTAASLEGTVRTLRGARR